MKKILLLLVVVLMPMALYADKDKVHEAYYKAIKKEKSDIFTLVVKHEDSQYVGSVLRSHDSFGWFDYSDGKRDYYKFYSRYNTSDFNNKMLELIIKEQNLSDRISASQFVKYSNAYVLYDRYSGLNDKKYREYERLEFCKHNYWTGDVDNYSYIEGHGYGFAVNDIVFVLYEGTFKQGFPQGKLNIIFLGISGGVGFKHTYSAEYNIRNEGDVLCFESDDKDMKRLTYCNTNRQGIFSGVFQTYGDYENGFRKAVYPDNKVIYLSNRGTVVSNEKMAELEQLAQTKQADVEDYSHIPDYPVTSNLSQFHLDLWKKWLNNGEIRSVNMNFEFGSIISTDYNWVKNEVKGTNFPEDQEERFGKDGILYFCYANGEAKANGWVENGIHRLSGTPTHVDNQKYYSRGELKIPATITSPETNKTYTVTSIGTFEGTKITTVFIPKTIRKCGRPNEDGFLCNAFADCKDLIKVVVEEGNPGINWGDNAFKGCIQLTDIPVNFSTAQINNGMFEGCKNLKSINLPVGIKELGSKCFVGCPLETLTIPSTVTKMDQDALESLSAPKVLHIPFNVYLQLSADKEKAKLIQLATDVKIRDEKYQLRSMADIYLQQCQKLDDYYKELLEINTSYENVKLNEKLVDDFIMLYDGSKLDTKGMVAKALEMKKEHKIVNLLRDPDRGNYSTVLSYTNAPSNYGFTPFHEKANPILEKRAEEINERAERLLREGLKKFFQKIDNAINSSGPSSSYRETTSSKSYKEQAEEEPVPSYKINKTEKGENLVGQKFTEYFIETTGNADTELFSILEYTFGYIWRTWDGTMAIYKTLDDAVGAKYAYIKYGVYRQKGRK